MISTTEQHFERTGASPILSALQQRQEATDALSRCLEDAINRLSAEQIYTHAGHNFKQSGDRLRGGCPHHASKSGSSFVVTISSKLFWCEGCQFGGGPADYRASLRAGRWVKARGRDFVEAARELATDANVPFPERESSPKEIAKAQKWERRRAVLAATQKYCQEVLWSDTEAAKDARRYLVAERGLTEEEIKRLSIGYYKSAGEVKRHLISKGFTKEDWEGTGCCWKGMEGYITVLWSADSGRPLTIYGRYFRQHPPEGQPKTIAAPGEKTKQSPLYLDRALIAGHKEIVLVEGVLDAVLLQAKGDTRVCAYVAASCSDDQIQTLKRRGITKVTLCGDPDHGGLKGTNSNLLRLTIAGISVYIAPKLPDELDPDEFLIREGMEGWNAHINAAVHGFRWKAQRLIESGNVATDSGKADILKGAIAFCKAVKNHPELDIFFWPVIRSSLGIEPEEFRAQLERLWESSPAEVASFGGGGSGGDDGGDGGSGKVVNHPKFTPITGDELDQRINELIAQKITGSKLTTHLHRLAVEAQWQINELKKLYFERKGEIEQTEEQVEAQSLLPSLLEVHRVNLREFLWGDEGLLADAMLETAKAMPTSPEFLLTTLIPTAATLIGTSSRIVIKAKGKYKQPCIFWTAVVARSGQLKTPAQKVILDPLIQLEIKANEQYQLDLEKYEIDLAYWKKDKNANPANKPKQPVRKRYLTKDATIEALERIHGQNPRGLLVHRDEIAEDFKADNAYRNGKGADKEKKLDQFNGSPLIVDRKEREIALERSAISRTGSIQWEVLQSLMGDGRDDNGTFARWLFCAAESPPRFINLLEDDIDTGIEELLMHLYKRLEKMPEDRDYVLSGEAKQLFQEWQHELVRAELEESHPGLQLVYPKIEAYTTRFALLLHVVNSALAEVTPAAVIGERVMSAAIKLAKYYLEQSKLVMVTNTPQSGLTGVLLKIQKYAQGKPNGVKVYKLKSGIKALRNKPQEELLSHCQWLSEHGYGSLKDNTYCVDRVDQLLPTGSTRSTPDSVVVSAKTSGKLLTNCCPKVNTVNTSNDEGYSDFVDFVDQIDPQNSGFSLQNLINTKNDGIGQEPTSVTTCNENNHFSLLAVNKVNTVNKMAEPHIESGVDHEQQLVNKVNKVNKKAEPHTEAGVDHEQQLVNKGQQKEGTNGEMEPEEAISYGIAPIHAPDAPAPTEPPFEAVEVSRCQGEIEGILWNEEFTPSVKKRKLAQTRSKRGQSIYEVAVSQLNVQDRADLEQLRQLK